MKIKTSELKGAALDWAVAKCEGVEVNISRTGYLIYSDKSIPTGPQGRVYAPSTTWAQGGPIKERENIGARPNGMGWVALHIKPQIKPRKGPTTLIAAMRCYVASKLGEEVEIPDELAEPKP